MEVAKVIGNVWATKKNERLNGQSFMVVMLLDNNNQMIEKSHVAVDTVGAGIGDIVLISTGSAARQALNNTNIPVDAAIVGIIDSIEVKNE